MDVFDYNRRAWDGLVAQGNIWTKPASPAQVARARAGDVGIVLTPILPVPSSWTAGIRGRRVLCLASGGGQQGPLLAAAGAEVTVLDASPAQLDVDRQVAAREGLTLETVEGDMRDLSRFADERFELIVHPVSNCFVEDVRPVWREVARVLARGGHLLAGFANPIVYVFDPERERAGELVVKYTIPYSDVTSLTDAERARYTDVDEPLCFGHTLEDQIGGQCDAGLAIVGMYEDHAGPGEPTNDRFPTYIATRARRIA